MSARATCTPSSAKRRAVEVEACLVEHPAVLEAAVIGREGADGLVMLGAHVALRRGRTASREELRARVRGRLAGFKVPRSVDIVAEPPRTATGKIQRFRLRAPA
jgi:benzoate-CoA ligase